MGHVILPSGATSSIDSINNSVSLSQLIEDMLDEDLTVNYRVNVINAIVSIGKFGSYALSGLREVYEKCKNVSGVESSLFSSADNAIKTIERMQHPERAVKEHTQTSTSTSNTSNVPGHNHHAPTTVVSEKIKANQVTFVELDSDNLCDGTKFYRSCNFCNKITTVTPYYWKLNESLVGEGKFYCCFCARNNFYTKTANNTMVLSLRGLIGYYYYSYYVIPKSSSMYNHELKEMIETHYTLGIQNPLFKYDQDTFCWFIDFSKIEKKKILVDSINATIGGMIAAFNVYENLPGVSVYKYYNKFKDAVNLFHETRERMNGNFVFAPTLIKCDLPLNSSHKPISEKFLTDFNASNLIDGNNCASRKR